MVLIRSLSQSLGVLFRFGGSAIMAIFDHKLIVTLALASLVASASAAIALCRF